MKKQQSKRVKKHKFEFKPLSWSAISSFQYNKESWKRKYVDGIIDPPNAAMQFGNIVGRRLESDPEFLPEVPRLPIFEKKLESKIDDIQLISYLDGFQEDPMAILEYKTTSNAKRWTQKTAEEHGQLLFYLAMLWLVYQVPPEKIKVNLVAIQCNETGDFNVEITKNAPIQNFEVKHTSLEVLKFLLEVRAIYKDMLKYADEQTTTPSN